LVTTFRIINKTRRNRKIKKANVLVVGLGGVGSFAAEFLARAGVGNLTIVDGDV
jgi:tRNA A37 threonylcarbamoyladenosine dehydratase